jgi:uncharacterized protein (TIGR02996 family)
MTRDEAFLLAIREQPESDEVRLVYADWLEERGDPRGEFIRVQCEQARLSVDNPRRAGLDARAAELLEANWDAWVGALRDLLYPRPTSPSGREIWMRHRFHRAGLQAFRRGFVEVLMLDAETFLRCASELLQMTPLRHLLLVRAGTHVAALAALGELATIESLRFTDYYVDPVNAAGARALAASPSLGRLAVINLFRNNIEDEGLEALAHSPGLVKLRHLNVIENGITDPSARALASSPLLARLQSLSLENNFITRAGEQALLSSPYLRPGTVITLAGNPCRQA